MRKPWLFLSALALSTPMHAADFADAYQAAKQNDPTFAEASAKLDAAREKTVQGRAGLLPTVSLSGNAMYNNERVEDRDKNRTDHWDYGSYGITLSLTQPLFRWQNWLGYDQSKLVVAQAEAGFANAQQDLILRTAQAYFDVVYARENLEAARAYLNAVASQLDVASKSFEVGTGVVTDVHDAQTRFSSATAQVIAAETDLDLRLHALEAITGPLPSAPVYKRQGLALSPPQPAELGKWLEAAEQNNLTVQQQRLAVEIASREQERMNAGHYPTVDLVASVGETSTLSSGDRQVTDAGKVGVQFALPIYQGGEVSSRVSEAAANRRAALAAQEAARRSAALSARQSYLGVVNGLTQVKALESADKAARSALASNKDAFDVGVRLNIDVLNAQNLAYVTYRDMVRANIDTLLSQLRLKAAVGTLGESDVEAINAQVKP